MSLTLTPMEYGEAIELTHPCEPISWTSQGLTVVRDGYDVDGTRIHMVLEGDHYDSHISNAHVFTLKEGE